MGVGCALSLGLQQVGSGVGFDLTLRAALQIQDLSTAPPIRLSLKR